MKTEKGVDDRIEDLESLTDSLCYRVFKLEGGNENKNPIWESDRIQFARLICEIVADQSSTDMARLTTGLCNSMDLEPDGLKELFERAEMVFEAFKRSMQ